MGAITRPAPGTELHEKQCPPEERDMQYLVCYSEHPGCWYTLRGAQTRAGAGQMVRRLRKRYGGALCEATAFRIWDTHGPWPTA